MKLDELNFDLPKELIAQTPLQKRDECKLLIYDKTADTMIHTQFKNIIHCIHSNDILIFNNTKVFSARLFGIKKETNAKIEILLLEKKDNRIWKAILKPAKRIKLHHEIALNKNNYIIPFERLEEGNFLIQFNKEIDYEELEKIGNVPLPPYITRDYNEKIDKDYYQTIYAKEFGAVAAPTAGFHFTEELMSELRRKNVKMGFITLHISYATFAPIREERIEQHKMHSEYLIVPEETVKLINENRNGKIIAVGTTVIRALESVARKEKKIKAFSGYINTYIYPGYRFKIVDNIITNFHLPKSTLLLLIAAFIGLDKLKELYQEAIKQRYRFFSYGDAMMIVRKRGRFYFLEEDNKCSHFLNI